MKNIKYLFIFSILAALVACEADYEPLNEYADVKWYTSAFRSEKINVGIDEFMTFMDLSRNAKSHKWSFADTSGCKFLKGRITNQDSTYYPFIDESMGISSTDHTVHILFTKGGMQHVRLYNTYDEYVAFEGRDTLEAELINGEWVIDTLFAIDVWDSIQPAFKVYQNDAEILDVAFDNLPKLEDKELWPEVEVEFGTSLTFVDLTEKGRPDTYSWEIKGATPEISEDSVSVVSFNQIGTFTGKYTASRTDESIPGGSKMKLIPIKIKVVPSDAPFVLADANPVAENTEDATDTKVRINVTAGIDAATVNKASFSATLTTAAGTVIPVTVDDVVAKDGMTFFDLVLSETLYDDDVITVTYDATQGTVMTLDTRELESFTNLSVAMLQPNMWDDAIYGFETGHDAWIDAGVDGTFEITDEKAATGTYSLKLTSEAGSSWTAAEVTSEEAKANLTPGQVYILSYSIWRDPSSTHAAIGPWLKWGNSTQEQFYFNMNSVAKGEWVDVVSTKEWPYGGTGLTWFWVRVKDNNIVYIDNIKLTEQEIRPVL